MLWNSSLYSIVLIGSFTSCLDQIYLNLWNTVPDYVYPLKYSVAVVRFRFPFCNNLHSLYIWYSVLFLTLTFHKHYFCPRRSQWPRCIRRASGAVRLLGLRVRIPLEAWMSVCCECKCSLLSGRVSYRVWCVWVWSWSLRQWRGGPRGVMEV